MFSMLINLLLIIIILLLLLTIALVRDIMMVMVSLKKGSVTVQVSACIVIFARESEPNIEIAGG